MSGLRRVTIVVEGGDVGAAFAIALGADEGVAHLGFSYRREGVQVSGLVLDDDTGARDRWAKRCRREGLAVVPAPWERKKEKNDG